MPFTVGLTGGIGSGKSSAARLFGKQGALIVDTDAIARELTADGAPALNLIRKQFGNKVFQPDGALDRARLRRLVFADSRARKKLESLLHPLVRTEALKRLRAGRAPYAILVVPLLLETGGLRGHVQRVLVVDCPEALQVARAMSRSNLSEAEVRAIMAAQLSREARLKLADDVLSNDSSMEHLQQQVETLHRKYFKLAQYGPAMGS